MVTTGGPKVIFGTKCPSIISTCSQSAPCSIVSEHALPRAPKSALRIEGAMIAAGAMVDVVVGADGLQCRLTMFCLATISRASKGHKYWVSVDGLHCFNRHEIVDSIPSFGGGCPAIPRAAR